MYYTKVTTQAQGPNFCFHGDSFLFKIWDEHSKKLRPDVGN